MTSNLYVLLFLLVGISTHVIVGQLVQPFGAQQSEPNQPFTSNAIDNNTPQIQDDPLAVAAEAEEEDPEPDDAMSRLGQVTSLEGFLELMDMTPSDIYDDMVDEDGKQVISGGGRMATPDNCSPRNTTIRITMEDTDSDVAFFPRCTKIERCGGCCSSPQLECRPSYTERVSLKVLKGRVPFPGATHLQYTGFAPVIVDRHVTCRVVCILTPEKCGPLKTLNRRQCRCNCKNSSRCRPPKVFDQESCTCQCPAQLYSCCAPYCNTNTWDDNQCDCIVGRQVDDGRRHISIEGNSGNNNGSANAAAGTAADSSTIQAPAPTTPPTTPTTTSTTTTTSTSTAADPCATRECPPRFVPIARGNACLCRPPRINRGRSRGGRRG